LPHLQKLYDRVKDRKDIQIVTFSIDDNIAAIAPFMKENKYTFPVVQAHLLMHDLMPTITIPLNWFVDANGVVRFERVGFGDLGKWVDETLEQLEKLRTGVR
jgi:hypothetical protein